MNAIPHTAFSYELPPERIAQRPVKPYDHAKLLVIDRQLGALSDGGFTALPEMLRPGDLLVLNDTRVLRARLLGAIAGTGAAVELLCLERTAEGACRCLGKPLKKLRPGVCLQFDGGLVGTVIERLSEFEVLVSFTCGAGDVAGALEQAGIMPIPPYIRKGRGDGADLTDYQTFYAARDGSVAAPTAGLHFTPELCAAIETAGCGITFTTLHVGPASFLPLWDESQELRHPGAEFYRFSGELLRRCAAARAAGGRVVAVGTTVVRALESMARAASQQAEGALCSTNLFITPGFDFALVDVLITNFHQPRTTHLLLVEAFMGARLLSAAYAYALAREYRFLSYGDGMVIL